ncbi:MAG: hypothetical protein L3J18_04865 [Candidatus Brocadia sp.]|nr:hypothetical protein [Candidatus Brocadia sp.]MDG5995942.1 hypothetical protein [Candidatus Brocadia sp.]UJS21641.1 MAG: hypothetical protein L3J18_04865 [Candidatus Brocadia sp.]
MAPKKHATNKLVLSSFFRIITIDGKTEQVTTRVRRTLFFDDEDSFPFSKIKNVEVAKDIKESIPNDCIRYLVLLNLANGDKILIDEIGESSPRGGMREMKNLGKKISAITGKTLKTFED